MNQKSITFILIMFLFPNMSNIYFSEATITTEAPELLTIPSLHSSQYYKAILDVICIEETHPRLTWEYYATHFNWFLGSGTQDDPYIFENYIVYSNSSYYGIRIGNSNAYFIIRNCLILCSEKEMGIYLYNSSNGLIHNCKIYSKIGFYLEESQMNIIKENSIICFEDGIRLEYSTNNQIVNNSVNSDFYGITLVAGFNNTIKENQMSHCGIHLSGSFDSLVSHSIYNTNLVNNKPIVYSLNESNLKISTYDDAGQIILVNCRRSVITDSEVYYAPTGISLYYCSGVKIIDNRLYDNIFNGILLDHCTNIKIIDNIIIYNELCGIKLCYSELNTILYNHIENNLVMGIYLARSAYNRISDNNISQNSIGIRLFSSSDNDIFENHFTRNTDDISEEYSYDNSFTRLDYFTKSFSKYIPIICIAIITCISILLILVAYKEGKKIRRNYKTIGEKND